jgi:hypothetical protein
MAHRPLVSLLWPVLKCPDRRCGKVVYIRPEVITGLLVCAGCDGHFWVTRLDAGSVRQQLLVQFDDGAVVDHLMRECDLPTWIDSAMYWHVWLPGREFHAYNKDQATGPWARSRGLFRRLLQRKAG